MISKQLAKFVKSLKLKKYRKKAAAFVVEGAKNVSELLSSGYEVQHLFITEKYLKEYGHSLRSEDEYTLCTEKELINIGTFQSNEYALAVAKMIDIRPELEKDRLVLALDDVQDPGNLGTIIRIADWYGIRHIIASEDTADFYNPKVINSSMGSFTRVHVYYTDLKLFLKNNQSFRVYGTFLEGKNIHKIQPQLPAIILMGSESTGISPELSTLVTDRVTIPRFGGAESLNVAVSAAIICDNFLRH
jgi:TrmH family RNA methyltransferase